jgi:hypothetical protein
MPNKNEKNMALGRFIPRPNNIKITFVIMGPMNQAIGRLIKNTKNKFIPKSCVRGITGNINPLIIPISVPAPPIVDTPTASIPALCISE